MKEAAEKEWKVFRDERSAGIDEISELRERVAAEEARRKTERSDKTAASQEDTPMGTEGDEKPAVAASNNGDVKMEVDGGKPQDEKSAAVKEEKTTPTPGPGDDDDAVEY